MGIRKKIALGFLCLGLMLAFSGMTSLVELNRLGKATRSILDSSTQNIEVSKRMLDASQEQNTSLLQLIVLGREDVDSTFLAEKHIFERALSEASQTVSDRSQLDSIYAISGRYYKLIDDYFSTPGTDIEWFVDMYRTTYLSLTTAIKDYMMASQRALITRAQVLESNAYRAISPGIISLCVAILMVLIFAYLLDIYYTKPILGITKGLRNFVLHKVPFNVKMEGHDEIFNLKEYIEALINMYKNKKPE